MKTIYECSQSKVIKWFTVIFFLIVIGSVLMVIYNVSQGADPTAPILVTALLLVVSISCFFVCPLSLLMMRALVFVRCLEPCVFHMRT